MLRRKIEQGVGKGPSYSIGRWGVGAEMKKGRRADTQAHTGKHGYKDWVRVARVRSRAGRVRVPGGQVKSCEKGGGKLGFKIIKISNLPNLLTYCDPNKTPICVCIYSGTKQVGYKVHFIWEKKKIARRDIKTLKNKMTTSHFRY